MRKHRFDYIRGTRPEITERLNREINAGPGEPDHQRAAGGSCHYAKNLQPAEFGDQPRLKLALTKMKSNFQERIIAILQDSPNGLTSNEIAERLGATAENISPRLSKLAAYGIIVKTRYRRGPRGNVYR